MQPTRPVADLAIIIVSTNEARWLEPCLQTVFDHAGEHLAFPTQHLCSVTIQEVVPAG